MKNKITLIIDKSPAYLNSLTDDEIKKFKYNKSNVRKETSWSKNLANTKELFGQPKMVVLDLSDANNAKSFASLIPNKKKNSSSDYIVSDENSLFYGNWWGNGVIIKFLYPAKESGYNNKTSSAGLTKIMNLVKQSNGKIIDNSKSKSDKIENDLLKKYPLNINIKTAIKNYIGEEYDKAISLTKALDKLSKEEIKNLTLNEIAVYLPNVGGRILPWEPTNALFEMNLKQALIYCDRIIEENGKEIVSPIVVMASLKNTSRSLLEASVCYHSGFKTIEKISQALNSYTNNFLSIKPLINMGKMPSPETASYILKLVVEADSYYKGNGTIIDQRNFLKNLFNKIYLALKFNAPLKN